MKKLNFSILIIPLTTSVACLALLAVSKCSSPPFEREGVPEANLNLEYERHQSSLKFSQPQIDRIFRGSELVWSSEGAGAEINPGDTLEIQGSGFGAGPVVDYSKILFGNARAIESDMKMFVGNVDIAKALYFEENKIFDQWDKDILSWKDTQIKVKVPSTASSGKVVISVQKRIGTNKSYIDPSKAATVWDPNSERIHGPYNHTSDTVSKLSEAKLSNSVLLKFNNPEFSARVADGEKIFWGYDYNIGAVHNARGLDWSKILSKKTIDPFTGKTADPITLFGAIPLTKEVKAPSVAKEKIDFNPYPIPNPLSTLTGQQDYSGSTHPTGYAGYIYATSLSATGKRGNWIGFSCVSCHGQLVEYSDKNGKKVKEIFPGLPNPNWSMKWTVLSNFKGVKGKETGLEGEVDKSLLLYSVPKGAGEHTLLRSSEDVVSPYRNDFLFSPIAIPNVTTHTPLRRSLSHTELYAGFEGSYIHSEEPDGAIGSMRSESLKNLTSYMTVLNKNDDLLHKIALYRWLKENSLLSEIENKSERDFLYGEQNNFPMLNSRLERGQKIYAKNCLKCHANNFGTGSNEDIMPLHEVGTYFSPTLFQREVQGIRSSMMTHLYWVEKRGLLHDGHVKSLEDLVTPSRCDIRGAVYKRYYTINSKSFKVPVGTPEQNKAIEAHHYFSKISSDPNHYYWDYQKMLKEFGPRELGTSNVVRMSPVPHPWCLENTSEVQDLVAYAIGL